MRLEHINFAWWILFLPLFSAAVITLFTLKNKLVSSLISIGAVSVGFVLTCIFVYTNGIHTNVETTVNWLTIGNLSIDFGLKLDALSMMMLFVVTGVGGLIHIYSYGYMHDDESMARFFAKLSLFTFSMLGIVLANNFLMMFIFWELVGISSYLLIGFWYEKASAGDAAKKAFITNRLGDFGFLFGILLVWGLLGSLNFSSLQHLVASTPLPEIKVPAGADAAVIQNQIMASVPALGCCATVAALLIFCGCMGKSAQFPLHVWLPDAMEGPTPVSALIHAATMVAAGVYMLCRTLFLFNAESLHIISYIGGFTALIAALMAVQQNDIKRIIAYSTLSQLGYMVMVVGLNGPTPAMFHLTTHAFFKALLFLAAGSVILGMHHEQDIWHMGNLRKKMPITFITFTIGALALSGIPPFAGFYSKDSILAQCLEQGREHPMLGYPLFGVAVFVAGLTAFYTFRLFFVVFFGKEKSDHAKHAHESPLVMTAPLMILAVFAAIGGFIGITNNYGSQLAPGHEALSVSQQFLEPLHAPIAMCVGIGVAVAGIFLAFLLYKNADKDPLPTKLGALATWMRDKFYFDELYEKTVIRVHDLLAAVSDFIDRWILEGAILGFIRGGTDLTGRALRLVQTGNLQTYAFLFVFGVAVLLYFVLVK